MCGQLIFDKGDTQVSRERRLFKKVMLKQLVICMRGKLTMTLNLTSYTKT